VGNEKMHTVYTYLEEALQNSHIDIPWRLSYVAVAKQVVLQTYLPVVASEDITFLDKYNQPLKDIDYLELKFIFTADHRSNAKENGIFIIQPEDTDQFQRGHLDILAQEINHLLYAARLQIKELISGERVSVDLQFPDQEVKQMITTRRAINRYDDTELCLGDDTNDLV
jgi:hypothetical protein